MSQEQNNASENQCCEKKVITFLTVLALVFSVISLTISTYLLVGSSSVSTQGKQISISKKYDKGRTLAKAQETNKPILVLFYTDWCGFSQRFAPVFDKITKDKRIKKKFAIAFVNAEKQENQVLMEEYKIQGFPTLMLIDEFGERTRLDNSLFFTDNAKEDVIKKIEEIMNKDQAKDDSKAKEEPKEEVKEEK